MILLTDRTGKETEYLAHSLRETCKDCTVVSVVYEGYPLKGCISPYSSYIYGEKEYPENPRFFNQIECPEYWEISGTGRSGLVKEFHKDRAKIYYTDPKEKRNVKIVDWLDENGKPRFSDHYDVRGFRYAMTVLDREQKPTIKTYYTPEGEEKIVENFVTGTIMLKEGNRYSIFRNKTEFVVHFLTHSGLDIRRICINSLGIPFFVSNELGRKGYVGRDILFWQEPIYKDIPGNMQGIFRGEATRVTKIAVQNKKSMKELMSSATASRDIYSKLGYIYPFERRNRGSANVLICTNSDRVLHLEELVKNLPEYTFHVAAVTEMSSKLMDLDSYKNLKLYPCISAGKAEQLFDECDYYLDINEGNEILSAIEKAFLHDQIIIGFTETLHDKDLIAPENTCSEKEAEVLINTFGLIMEDPEYRKELLSLQYEHAMCETKESFSAFLNQLL
ncbi:MAG: accessory Sec system glycosylation chaperone GtfB [Lachnospiraceae bacterium]|nr:accessory Sec system glycosylation chaperone GtfB [Lachnospiraceae bacterium]